MNIRQLINKLDSIESKPLAEAVDLQTVQAAVAGKDEQSRAKILQQMAEKEGLPGLYDPESGYFVSAMLNSAGEGGQATPRISATATKDDDSKLASLGLIGKNANTSTALGRMFGSTDDKYVNNLRSTSDKVVATQTSTRVNAENLKKLNDIIAKLSAMAPVVKESVRTKEALGSQYGRLLVDVVEWYDNRANLSESISYKNKLAGLGWTPEYGNELFPVILREDNGQGLLAFTPDDLGIETDYSYLSENIAQQLIESFGYQLNELGGDPAAYRSGYDNIDWKGNKPTITDPFAGLDGKPLTDRGTAGTNVANGRANYTAPSTPTTATPNFAPKGTPTNVSYNAPTGVPSTTPSFAPTSAAAVAGKETGMMSKMWGGAKGMFKSIPGVKYAAIVANTGIELWDMYQKYKDIPKDGSISQTQVHADVTKVVTKAIADIGIFWVGALLGAAIAGALTGPGAIVGFVAGGVGGLAADHLLGDSVHVIIDKFVNWVFGTKNVDYSNPSSGGAGSGGAGSTKWPTTPEDIKAFQKNNKDKDGKPLVVDGIIGSLTYQALIKSGAKPPAGFTVTPYKTNADKPKPDQGSKPEEVKPAYDVKNDPAAMDLLKQANQLRYQLSDVADSDPAIAQALKQAQEVIDKFGKEAAFIK